MRNTSLRSNPPPKSLSPSRYNWDRTTDGGRYGTNVRTSSDSVATASSSAALNNGITDVAAAAAAPSTSSSTSSYSSRYGEKACADDSDGKHLLWLNVRIQLFEFFPGIQRT